MLQKHSKSRETPFIIYVGLLLFAKTRKRQLIDVIQSKLFITSLVITEYSISDIKLLGTDLFPSKFPLYNRVFT